MPTVFIEAYYKILGVSANSSTEEIKRAYRIKAKQLHPDRNPSPDAHEQFIFLTEAYECLLNQKRSGLGINEPSVSYSEWQQKAREEVRKRTNQYARMRYEEFIKSDYYKAVSSIDTVFSHLYFLFGIAVAFLLPLIAALAGGWKGFLYGLLTVFLLSPILADAFSNASVLNLKEFKKAFAYVFKIRSIIYTLIGWVNVFLFFRIIATTELPAIQIVIVFAVYYAICYISYEYLFQKKITIPKRLVFGCIVPSLFNLFFLANSFFGPIFPPKTPTQGIEFAAAEITKDSATETTAEDTVFRIDTVRMNSITFLHTHRGNKLISLSNLATDTIIKGEDHYSDVKFIDINLDGYEDIRVFVFSNTPNQCENYFFDSLSKSFHKIKNADLSIFPVQGSDLFYSYNRAGCADLNWESHLIKIKNWEATTIGFMNAKGCGDPYDGIYISKVLGKEEVFLKKLPIEVSNRDKFKFIENYWKDNFRYFISR